MAKFWGSRFEGATDKLADLFSYSIRYDYRLAKYDCLAGMAHAKMLGDQKIIPAQDAKKIINGLKSILKQIEGGKFGFDPSAEDIHTNIQEALKKRIGAPADKLHAARSRNDLVVTDMKLYCRDEICDIVIQLKKLQKSIVTLAAKYSSDLIPAYTHLQGAQIVLFAHQCLAYVEMIERDVTRMEDALVRFNESPLGSCALSGTSLPIDRKSVAKSLLFDRASANSIDSVSDRDFIMETLSALSIFGVHASRIAEDLIIYSSNEFRMVNIDWTLCTGSSIMPHKKNPDILELIRGESAGLIANANQIQVLLKGTPLTYNRDFQLDKLPLFDSIEKVGMIIPLLTKCFQTLKINRGVIDERIKDESYLSVDIMEYLIRKGVSYREAHDTVGRMIRDVLDRGRKLADLGIADFRSYHKSFDNDVKKLLDPKASVLRKQSDGSTHPDKVNAQIKIWKSKLKSIR